MGKLNSYDYYHHHDVIWQLYKYTVSPWPKLKKLLGTKDRSVDTLKKICTIILSERIFFSCTMDFFSLMHTVYSIYHNKSYDHTRYYKLSAECQMSHKRFVITALSTR